MKKELSNFIHEDITYKNVRDGFKNIGFGGFDVDSFVTNVLIDELKSHYKNKSPWIRQYKHFISCDMRNFLINNISENVDPEISMIANKGVIIFNKAVEEGLISKVNDNHYEITKTGHSLRMQKAIKRIPLERAHELINKLLEKIESLDSKDLPYKVDSLYVYGSVQRHEATAGDIDLAISYSRNERDGETRDDWIDRVAKQYNVSSYEAYFLYKKLTKELKISPYISLSNESDLAHLMEVDTAEASFLYHRDKTVAPNIRCQEYKMPITEEESSFSM